MPYEVRVWRRKRPSRKSGRPLAPAGQSSHNCHSQAPASFQLRWLQSVRMGKQRRSTLEIRTGRLPGQHTIMCLGMPLGSILLQQRADGSGVGY